MTLLMIFAEMNLVPCLTVAKGSVTLAIGSIIIRDVTIEAALLSAAKHVLGQPIAAAYDQRLKEWINEHK
jgi:hypothetical protein